MRSGGFSEQHQRKLVLQASGNEVSTIQVLLIPQRVLSALSTLNLQVLRSAAAVRRLEVFAIARRLGQLCCVFVTGLL